MAIDREIAWSVRDSRWSSRRLNEARNLPILFKRLRRSLLGIAHEVIVADDASTDGTADLAEDLAANCGEVRVLRRTSNFGLSQAILDGFQAARGDVLGVMDADLQHDPRVLPNLLQATETADIAIGSRYAFQGKTCGWSFLREVESRLAALVTRTMLGLKVADPLSGFFLLRREVFESVAPALQARGWKLLLEILALSPGATVAEVPFTFRSRVRGKTKMNRRVVLAWLSELRRLRRLQPRAPALAPRMSLLLPRLRS